MKQITPIYGRNQQITKFEPRGGQAKSKVAVWEVLECCDSYIMFSRPDSFAVSAGKTLIKGRRTGDIIRCKDYKASTVKPLAAVCDFGLYK